jgi:hypothetical protein
MSSVNFDYNVPELVLTYNQQFSDDNKLNQFVSTIADLISELGLFAEIPEKYISNMVLSDIWVALKGGDIAAKRRVAEFCYQTIFSKWLRGFDLDFISVSIPVNFFVRSPSRRVLAPYFDPELMHKLKSIYFFLVGQCANQFLEVRTDGGYDSVGEYSQDIIYDFGLFDKLLKANSNITTIYFRAATLNHLIVGNYLELFCGCIHGTSVHELFLALEGTVDFTQTQLMAFRYFLYSANIIKLTVKAIGAIAPSQLELFRSVLSVPQLPMCNISIEVDSQFEQRDIIPTAQFFSGSSLFNLLLRTTVREGMYTVADTTFLRRPGAGGAVVLPARIVDCLSQNREAISFTEEDYFCYCLFSLRPLPIPELFFTQGRISMLFNYANQKLQGEVDDGVLTVAMKNFFRFWQGFKARLNQKQVIPEVCYWCWQNFNDFALMSHCRRRMANSSCGFSSEEQLERQKLFLELQRFDRDGTNWCPHNLKTQYMDITTSEIPASQAPVLGKMG